MPKRPKKVICPRCHRAIQADEFRIHLLGHKGKKIAHLLTSVKAETKQTAAKYPEFEEFTKLPGFGEIFEKSTASKPVKSNLSKDQIRAKFEESLRDIGAKNVKLKLEATKEPVTIEVIMDEQRNVVLEYNPLLMGTLTEKAIDGLLLHEACHVCTLPDTLLHIPDMGDPNVTRFLGNSITNYDEYLAHVEFVKRFRNDPRYEGLKEHQVGLFANFEVIVNSLKIMAGISAEAGQRLNEFWVLEQLGAIIYDSMFFFAAGDDSFLNWCESHSLKELATFASWFYEDFEHIRKLNLGRKEALDKVMAAATLSTSVNALKLLLYGQMEFSDTTAKTYEKSSQTSRDVDLLNLWERRRRLYQAK